MLNSKRKTLFVDDTDQSSQLLGCGLACNDMLSVTEHKKCSFYQNKGNNTLGEIYQLYQHNSPSEL